MLQHIDGMKPPGRENGSGQHRNINRDNVIAALVRTDRVRDARPRTSTSPAPSRAGDKRKSGSLNPQSGCARFDTTDEDFVTLEPLIDAVGAANVAPSGRAQTPCGQI